MCGGDCVRSSISTLIQLCTNVPTLQQTSQIDVVISLLGSREPEVPKGLPKSCRVITLMVNPHVRHQIALSRQLLKFCLSY